MKIKNILYATLFAASLLFQSCSLDEDTSGISSPDNFFRKYSECQSVVNSCYIPIKSIYTYTYMLATECVTDIAYCPSGTRDASLDISPAVPRFGSTVWTQGYLGVQRCNFAVNGIERAYQNEVLSEEQYLQLLCEAKTLRAFYYWTLTCFFGNVPFYFDDVTDNEVLNRIQVLPRMDANETRNKVIEDLQSIAPLAAQTRTYDNEANRLGASCAYMLIAKMAMWNKEWDTALEALQQIETIYGPLSQYDPEHPLPQQEHSRIHHGDSAHLHAGRSHLYLQRGLHLPALSAFGQLVHLRRRRHSRTRRSGDRMDGHAAERLLLSGTPIQDGQGYPRQIQHGVGL